MSNIQPGDIEETERARTRYRRSYQLGPSRVLLLNVGMWLAIGVLGLFDVMVGLVGRSTGWAYLIAAILMLPTLLSHFELRSWLGHHGPSYRLFQAMERPQVTFMAGWTYLLGWAALSAMMARIFARYAYALLEYLVISGVIILPTESAWWIQTMLAIGLVLIFTVTTIIGYRPAWVFGANVMGSVVALVVLIIVGSASGAVQLPATPLPASNSIRFFEAVALLMAAAWSSEIIYEIRGRRQTLRTLISGQMGGPLLAAVMGVAAVWGGRALFRLAELPSEQASLAGLLMMAYGLYIMAMAWQMLALLMLRHFNQLGREGILPERLTKRMTRFKTPVLLILFQSLISIGALSIGDVDDLAGVAALAYLLLQTGVNVMAVVMARHPRGEDRSVTLPLFPLIQASGAGINILLILTLPLWPAILLGLGWYALGGLIYWRVGRTSMRSLQLGVTVFQDMTRRPDLTSNYPVLVPIANPDTAMNLVAFGAAIAKDKGGHLVILQTVLVPEHVPLDVGRWQAQQKLGLLDRVLEEAEAYGIPVEGVTRAARSITQGIVDTLNEEGARLCVLGWNARPAQNSRRGLGHIIDEVLDNAPCDVAIVRGHWHQEFKNVLVPASTGPHTPRAAEFALALASTEPQGMVTLLNVTRMDSGEEGLQRGREIVEGVKSHLSRPELVHASVLTATSPLEGIVEGAGDQDAILLGVSEASVLTQDSGPQLPIQLAQEVDHPLALIYNYAGLTNLVARKAWQSVTDILPTLAYEQQMDVYRNMRQAARPSINYFVLIVLSALIATLGLMLNSPAVIIGAMLVAPLMSPIVSTSVGMVFGNGRMLRDALTSTIQGTVVAIFIAVLMVVISPIQEATPEILARTSPTLLDLLVALFSGMAGAYAIGRREVGEALPGVAIAAALMPPVCTVGIGIALGDPAIAGGALLLYVTNLVTIIFAAAMIFLMLGMRPFSGSPDRQRALRQGLIISIASMLVVSVPLGFILWQTTNQSQIEAQSRVVIREVTDEWGEVELVEFRIDYGWQDVTITGTLQSTHAISEDDRQYLEDRIQEVVRPNVRVELFVIEGQLLKPSDN